MAKNEGKSWEIREKAKEGEGRKKTARPALRQCNLDCYYPDIEEREEGASPNPEFEKTAHVHGICIGLTLFSLGVAELRGGVHTRVTREIRVHS